MVKATKDKVKGNIKRGGNNRGYGKGKSVKSGNGGVTKRVTRAVTATKHTTVIPSTLSLPTKKKYYQASSKPQDIMKGLGILYKNDNYKANVKVWDYINKYFCWEQVQPLQDKTSSRLPLKGTLSIQSSFSV